MIRLLHLSDIHFSRPVGNSLLDIDAAVRTDLLNDLRALDGEITPIHAILVVGDVAATGAVQEYDRANQFLDETANLVCCDRASVVCVPGNHDVDWTKQKPLHDGLRRLLRTAEPRRVGSSSCESYGMMMRRRSCTSRLRTTINSRRRLAVLSGRTPRFGARRTLTWTDIRFGSAG